MSEVAITGYALASPFGRDPEVFWQGICGGPTPARPWSAPGFDELTWDAVRLPVGQQPEPRPGQHPVTELALDLVRRALAAAGLDAAPAGAGLSLGSHFAETDYLTRPPTPWPAPMLQTVAREGGFTGPTANTPIGCAAGNLALSWATDRVAAGDAEVMVAGGVDLFGACSMGTFQLFDNLSEGSPRPFDADRDGFLFGEGGALLVLEQAAHARARGAAALAHILGTGNGHDAAHPTRPSQDGRGLRRSMETALREAGLEPCRVDYVNAHSPGTLANDPAEAAAYGAVFGPRGVPVSSTKGALGHAMGGANGLEAAACLLALEHQIMPPTLNTAAPDPAFQLDLVLGAPRPARLDVVLSAACGMGGANSAVLFGAGA